MDLLLLDLEEQWSVVDDVYGRVRARRSVAPDAPEAVEALAYQLHNFYGACGQLFELVARAFENQIDGGRYHVDLLRRMRMEIEGVRPALLAEPLAAALDELRAFRHFFRHAYGVELRPEAVLAAAETAELAHPLLREALDRFADRLRDGDEA